MELLPKSHAQFADAGYWDDFFRKRGRKAFEWYGEYNQLSLLLHTYIKVTDLILIPGCGNSELGADLYDHSYTNVTSIDISDVVIREMISQNSVARPQMKFMCMDVTKMNFTDETFNVVLDKGTLDALMPDGSEQSQSTADAVLTEAFRVLRPAGRYICVTLAQQHVIDHLVRFFENRACIVRVHRMSDSKQSHQTSSSSTWKLPVFVVVVTKLKQLPGFRAVLETAFLGGKAVRCTSAAAMVDSVKELQYYALLQHKLFNEECHEEVRVDLYSPENELPRYSIYVLDSQKPKKVKFAVFIIPQGREAEWLFSTSDGRQQLLSTAGHQRLAVVTLSRQHVYAGGMEQVKDELSACVMELAPRSLPKGTQVPYLSVGEGIGHRTILKKGVSEHSGLFYVEDVEVNPRLNVRQLVFASNLNLVQTQFKLQTKKHDQASINKKALMSAYHVHFVAALSLLSSPDVLDESLQVLIIGLGGGALPSFLHSCFPKMVIEVIEIDGVMVALARELFDLVTDDRLTVKVADGLQYVSNCASSGTSYNCVMVDVDNKDSTTGMSCPPEPFVTDEFLSCLRDIVRPGGVAVVNVSCRQAQLRQHALDAIRGAFGHASRMRSPEDVNETVVAARHPLKPEDRCLELAAKLQAAVGSGNQGATSKLDLAGHLRSMAIC